MEEESMEEEGGSSSSYEAMMDDQNHNNWEAGVDGYRQQHPAGHAQAPLGDRALQLPADRKGHRGQQEEEEAQMVPEANGLMKGCDSAGAAGKGGAVAAAIINTSTSKFLMNVITIEDYKSTYWPKLDSAIDQLLTQSPGDYIPISYEQIYSCVYKCVCQQHSEQMYSDLIKKITNHLERVSKELQNKFYIETKLNRDLKDDLIKLFTEHVAEKHIYSLMPLLLEAQSTPFQITPSTMANIVKGLYTLRPEWVQMAPALFSKFIPNILPPAVESELQEYAAQDQKLQRELMQNGFTRGDQSRKRAGEELTYNGSSACASSRGYR
ncbi:CDK2-associated and cullin domain-containing protein 1 isoform X2 [Gopherus flavomarginatus]|uniref:CDK2-associated and cullin domain-containing protein 1 isoform X2 n=1 Tax=Chelonoidis abingdonii TaxID=106734 RepID=UPI0013F21990|nr:CDK2-associated and cullin domain-containing protein 1 isoform X2 [Chelonoidis abingdonii]XP_050815005.1 CDK2-associated and cullin domain-containing protein 1 isoform X2 [Gopherus flavomarginatus]